MSKSCHHNLPSSCVTSEIIDDVKNKIESCIQEYMNLEETVTYLQKNHKINHDVTKLIWDQLQRDSPEFFTDYHLKLEMTRQIKMFNGLLARQVALMIEFGELDISSNPSSAILKFLSQDPEGVRVLDKLANSPAYPEVNPSSLAMAGDTNGPTVDQLQIPNDQQNQVQPYHWSTSNVFTAPTYAPAAFDQLFTSNGLPYNYHAASTVAPTNIAQWFPSNNFPNIAAPTFAQAATMPQDPYTFGFGGNIGCNGPSFMALDWAPLVMPSENQLNLQYLPPLQLQNYSQADQSTHQYEVRNNGIQYGGNNIGIMQSENQLQDLYGYHLPHLQLQNFPQQEQSTVEYEVSNNGIQHGGNTIGVMPSENQLNGQYLPPLQLQNFSQADQPTHQYEVRNNGIQYGGNNTGIMQSENQLQDLYGHHLLHLQLQNFPQQEQSEAEYEVSNNGIQHGGNNIGVMQFENQVQYQPQLELQQAFLPEELQPLQYGVSNSELQYGGNNNWLQNGGSNNGLEGVIHESEVFNNLNSGNGPLTMLQMQHDPQVQQGRGGL